MSDKRFAIVFGVMLAALFGFVAGRVIPRHGDKYKDPFSHSYRTMYKMDDIELWGFQLDKGDASPMLDSTNVADKKGWTKWTLTYYAKPTPDSNSMGQDRFNRAREMDSVCAAIRDSLRSY